MNHFLLKRKTRFLFLGLSVVLLLPNLFSFHLTELPLNANPSEKFDPALATEITSVSALLKKADAIASEKLGQASDTLAYTEIVTDLVNYSFYHGYSHYTLKENWMAALAGTLLWNDLSAIVLPDDILKYPMAACSQQSIVLAECFKQKGITYRKIGFDHHFALEALIAGKWYFFDSNKEPDFSRQHRTSVDSLIRAGALEEIYKNTSTVAEVKYFLANPYYGKPNAALASTAALFHKSTKVLSRFLFLAPFLIFALPNKKEQARFFQSIYYNKKKPVAEKLSPERFC